MTDLNDMTIEKFRLWSVNALRVYLSVRKRPINGNFDDLVARAFCVWEENITVDSWAEHEQRRLLQEYKNKLVVGGEKLEDPLNMRNGWIGEKDGMTLWPSVYIIDISDYLKTNNPTELTQRLVNEYKEGKAYRYFSDDWVKEIFVHNIDSKNEKCIVKSKVTPSQCVNNKPYDVWVILKKDCGDIPGGQVLQAYCTCTAGMHGSCNHIAGVLFRMEHAVKTGMTRPASTSKQCTWTIPKKKTQIKPRKVSEIMWKKSHYNKLPVDLNKENERSAKKRNFTPLRTSQEVKVKDSDAMRKEIYNLLKDDIPNSCFSLLMDKRKIVVCETKEVVNSVPESVLEIAKRVPSDGLSDEEKRQHLINNMKISEDQVAALNIATRGQSCSEKWADHRKGRVTASVFHRVYWRAKKLRQNSEENSTSVVDIVMGSAKFVQTTAMKHGIATEPIAKRSYNMKMKSIHKCFKSEDTGMFVYKEKPFISVSPDLLVDCNCCGQGLCEIKCPDSIKNQTPSAANVPYLAEESGGLVSLKTKSQYYYQIQGQMGVTGRKYCDLFVFTFHGSICVRVPFNETFFIDMISDIAWFWETYIADRLLANTRVLTEKDTNAS